MKRIALITLSLLTSLGIHAQIEGDSLFSTNQVVRIDLDFLQTGYWDSLTNNYTNDLGYMKANLTITTQDGVRTMNDIGVRFKGNSTYNHPNNKKPFKLDLNKYVTGQNYDGLKKLNLSNGFKDPSCMREKVFFDVCRSAGIMAPRANFATLYINGTRWGFYTIVEQIDDQYLDWAIGDDAGNLFKAGDNFTQVPGSTGTPADLVYYTNAQADYYERYELKTNETANDWSDLLALLYYINNTTDQEFYGWFDGMFEKKELLRSFAMDMLFGNLDSYTGSARNYYLYHNQTTNRWEWIKWDANEAFGSYANGQNTQALAINYHNSSRPLLDRIFNHPSLYSDYRTELCDLVENYFNNSYMDPIIDSYYSLIQSEVYADTKKMFTNSQFDQNIASDVAMSGGPMGGGSIYGLKSFVSTNLSNVNGQLDCNLFNTVNELENNPLLFYPNPTNGMLSIANSFNGTVDIRIFAMDGRLVYSTEINQTQDVLDLNFLTAGSYLIQSSSESGSWTETLLKN